jgi:hypothetical protein
LTELVYPAIASHDGCAEDKNGTIDVGGAR